MITADQGFAALQSVITACGALRLGDANEAETRKKVIDEILEKVLGWSTRDISYEEAVRGEPKAQYADYILRVAGTSIVVEAKRIGAAFSVPDRMKTGKISGVI